MTEYKKVHETSIGGLRRNDGTDIAYYNHDPSIYYNYEQFYCICGKKCDPGKGVILQRCCHSVCLVCIIDVIQRNTDVDIKCPYNRTLYECNGTLLHCEIRQLVTDEDFSNFLELSLKKFQPTITNELIRLDEVGAVENRNSFECPICFTVYVDEGEGIILRSCFHTFCKECLINAVESCENVEILCPFVGDDSRQCTEVIEQREIRDVLSAPAFIKYLERGLSQAELKIENTFHCLTPNCDGFFIVETGDNKLICSVCRQEHCINCKAIHLGVTCAEYKDKMSGYTKRTMNYIQTSVSQKEMMKCPRCKNYVIKNGGCNHMTCRCGAEFQWQGLK